MVPGVRVGDTLDGKYRIERFIGTGGMGIVAEATHVLLEQRVAIKFPRPELVERGDAAKRVLREARVAFAVKSEHVVRVLDLGLTGGSLPFIAMEYLDGKTVAELHRERPKWSVTEAAQIAMQAAKGVAAAHAVGLVHRDLKPSNLFAVRGTQGEAVIKVVDFGLAAPAEAVRDVQSITASGAVIGSPVYMSPEQARAEATDHRCDVWALGVILYELLSGTPPFSAANPAAAMGRILVDPAPPLRSKNPEVPAELEKVVMRCLRKSAHERYGSADELRLAIAAVVHEEAFFIEEIGGIRASSEAAPGTSSGVASTFASRTLAGRSGVEAPRRRWTLWFLTAVVLAALVLWVLGGSRTQAPQPSAVSAARMPDQPSSLEPSAQRSPLPPRQPSIEVMAEAAERPAPSAAPAVTVRRKPRRATPPSKGAPAPSAGADNIETAIETRR